MIAPRREDGETLPAFRARVRAWIDAQRQKEPDPMGIKLLDDLARLEAQVEAQGAEHAGLIARIDQMLAEAEELRRMVETLPPPPPPPPGPRIYTVTIGARSVAVSENEALVFACSFVAALMGREAVTVVLGGEVVELQAGDAYAIARQILAQNLAGPIDGPADTEGC